MHVASRQVVARLVAAGVVAVALGCGSTANNAPGTVIWISLNNGPSTVAVSVDIVSPYKTYTIQVPAGAFTHTNVVMGASNEFLTFKVTAPGANNNVACQISSPIVGPPGTASEPNPGVLGEVDIDADGSTTTVACGANWQ